MRSFSCSSTLFVSNDIPRRLVGRFDVAVQPPAIVRVVECAGDGNNDFCYITGRHTGGVTVGKELCRVGALDVVH